MHYVYSETLRSFLFYLNEPFSPIGWFIWPNIRYEKALDNFYDSTKSKEETEEETEEDNEEESEEAEGKYKD